MVITAEKNLVGCNGAIKHTPANVFPMPRLDPLPNLLKTGRSGCKRYRILHLIELKITVPGDYLAAGPFHLFMEPGIGNPAGALSGKIDDTQFGFIAARVPVEIEVAIFLHEFVQMLHARINLRAHPCRAIKLP
jgi:hypothetical protein